MIVRRRLPCWATVNDEALREPGLLARVIAATDLEPVMDTEWGRLPWFPPPYVRVRFDAARLPPLDHSIRDDVIAGYRARREREWAPLNRSLRDTPAYLLRVAGLPPIDYERDREEAAKRLGCRVSVLDALVKAAQPAAEPATGRGIKLREVTPWHQPVQLGELLDDIARAIGRHVILPPGAATALALWCAHTWVYQRFDHTPRLAIRSPTKRCGKSTLLEVVEALAHRPIQSGSISASGAFRIVEALAPVTLLLDETDSFLADKEELRGVLNSGFQRSGSVVRTQEIKGEHQPVQFATFSTPQDMGCPCV